MYRLFYESIARQDLRWSDIGDIFAVSRHNNADRGISGLLLHDGQRFFQVLEGSQHAVLALAARIADDRRHSRMEILSQGIVAGRQFADWDMACQEVTTVDDGRSFGGTVAALTARITDPDLASALSSFARLADVMLPAEQIPPGRLPQIALFTQR